MTTLAVVLAALALWYAAVGLAFRFTPLLRWWAAAANWVSRALAYRRRSLVCEPVGIERAAVWLASPFFVPAYCFIFASAGLLWLAGRLLTRPESRTKP